MAACEDCSDRRIPIRSRCPSGPWRPGPPRADPLLPDVVSIWFRRCCQLQLFAGEATRPLRIALNIVRCQDARRDLLAALESRTVIALAAGVIMAQNRCTQEEAFRAHLDE